MKTQVLTLENKKSRELPPAWIFVISVNLSLFTLFCNLFFARFALTLLL